MDVPGKYQKTLCEQILLFSPFFLLDNVFKCILPQAWFDNHEGLKVLYKIISFIHFVTWPVSWDFCDLAILLGCCRTIHSDICRLFIYILAEVWIPVACLAGPEVVEWDLQLPVVSQRLTLHQTTKFSHLSKLKTLADDSLNIVQMRESVFIVHCVFVRPYINFFFKHVFL